MIYIVSSQLNEFERYGVGDRIQKLIGERFIIVASDLTSAEQARAEEIARRIAASPSASVLDYQHHLPEAEVVLILQKHAEDVDKDVASFSKALAQRRAERLIQTVLMREDIRQIFDDLLSVGVFRDEEEIITRALQALFVAVSPHAKIAMQS